MNFGWNTPLNCKNTVLINNFAQKIRRRKKKRIRIKNSFTAKMWRMLKLIEC